jgi:hypothetical protein
MKPLTHMSLISLALSNEGLLYQAFAFGDEMHVLWIEYRHQTWRDCRVKTLAVAAQLAHQPVFRTTGKCQEI